jgi:putative transcriptional regulator
MAFIGGPVQQDTLHVLHNYNDIEGARMVLPGVYWGGEFDELRERTAEGRMDADGIRFFVGYSGWSAGQLDGELKENAWTVSDKVDNQLIFLTDPLDMWHRAMQRLGGRFARFSNYPTDPRLN